jgi:hypothetical protein
MSIFSLLLLAAAPTVKDCSPANAVFKINAVSLSPAVPTPGENVTLNLEYTVPPGVTVTDGQSKYSATYNFIPLTPTVEPLCKNIPCPLGPGTYINGTISQWPSGLSGTLKTTIQWFDQDSNPLLCIAIDARL